MTRDRKRQRRTEVLTVRFKPEDLTKIGERARARGLTISEVIREALFVRPATTFNVTWDLPPRTCPVCEGRGVIR